MQYSEERVDKRLEEYDSDLLGRMCSVTRALCATPLNCCKILILTVKSRGGVTVEVHAHLDKMETTEDQFVGIASAMVSRRECTRWKGSSLFLERCRHVCSWRSVQSLIDPVLTPLDSRTRLSPHGQTQSGQLWLRVRTNLHTAIMHIGAVFSPIGETLIFASTQ